MTSTTRTVAGMGCSTESITGCRCVAITTSGFTAIPRRRHRWAFYISSRGVEKPLDKPPKMRRKWRMKFIEWLRVFPPYLVRALARDRRRKRTPLTLDQLVENARAMGIRRDARWINEVSSRSSWSESRLDEITDFFAITGFSFGAWNRERAYMLRTFGRQIRKFSHIDQLPEAEREFILGLIVRHRDHISEILIRMHNIR